MMKERDWHELYCELSISSFQGDVGLQGDKGDKVCQALSVANVRLGKGP